MGTIIEQKALNAVKSVYGLQVYCSQPSLSGENCVSINKPLSEKLIAFKEARRTMRIERSLSEIINGVPDNAYIKDIDVLFNPNYKIDVLNVLIKLYRQKRFRLIWPGQLLDGKLIYGEAGYRDYHEYDISKYDILCVK